MLYLGPLFSETPKSPGKWRDWENWRWDAKQEKDETLGGSHGLGSLRVPLKGVCKGYYKGSVRVLEYRALNNYQYYLGE